MVTFTMLSTYKNSVDFSDLGIAMCLEYAYQNLIDGVSPSYTDPVGGFVLNNEAEYDAITWTDIRTKPTWTTVIGTFFNAWRNAYRNQIVNYGVKQDNYFALDKPALDLKADLSALTTTNSNLSTLTTTVGTKADTSSVNSALAGKAALSHTHAQSDVTGLSTSLAEKMNSQDSALTMKTYSGTTDANGEWTFSISGFANIKAVLANIDDSTNTVLGGAFYEVKAYSTSSITLKFLKGKNQAVLLAGAFDTTAYAASKAVMCIVVGTKV